MGSGSSSQVKTIENKTTATNNNAAFTGKELAALRRESTRSTTNVSIPNTTHSSEEKEPPATVVALKPTPSVVQSMEDAPNTSKANSVMSSEPSGLQLKLKQLQKELDESASEKLDLQDRIQALEERLQEVTTSATASASGEGGASDASSKERLASDLQETLSAKDLYIQQMEKQMAAAEAESKKVRLRLKKKIKTLTAQLNEAKQESSIAQLELKERNADLQEQLRHSSQGSMSAMASGASGGDDDDKNSKMKVILDLSAEVSEQSEKIATLERMLKGKDKEIDQLKREAARTPRQKAQAIQNEPGNQSVRSHTIGQLIRSSQVQCGPNARHVSFSRPSAQSSVPPVESVRDYSSTQGGRPTSKFGPRASPAHRDVELTLQRQSTALSDSDSDWEVDMSSAKIYSAPARVRVKSTATSAGEPPSSNADGEDKWSLATDDNDLIMTSEFRAVRDNSGRQKKRSALKTRLERERNEHAKGLMGPSLAFAAPAGDQLSDISCTPTPRPACADLGSKFTTSDVMAFAV